MHSKPRIAIIVPALAEIGGVPSVAAFLHDVLNRSARYEPSLISLATSSRDPASTSVLSPASWFKCPSITTGVWNGFEYLHVGCSLSEFEFQRYRPRTVLRDLLDSYDLVQIVSGSPAWGLVTQGCKPPVALQVATLTGVERQTLLSRSFDPWRLAMTQVTKRLDWLGLQQVEVVFVENSWMYNLLRSKLSAKIILAPPGVDTDFFHPSTYREDGYILCVGRLSDPRKNLRLLLEAYGYLRKALPNAPSLILAGESGPTYQDLQFARSSGIADSIQIRQHVSRAELARLYQNATLFVLSSNEEGLGIVILEAMASGIPVISTRCGGPEMMVRNGETGFLTPIGDASAMAARMLDLLSNPTLCRYMGEAGRKVVETSFSLMSAGNLFLNEYDRLLQ